MNLKDIDFISMKNMEIAIKPLDVSVNLSITSQDYITIEEILIENLLEKQGKNRTLILFAKSVLYEENKYIYKGRNLYD